MLVRKNSAYTPTRSLRRVQANGDVPRPHRHGQRRLPHQERIDPSGRRATLGDRPHNQRLATTSIACRVDARLGRSIVIVALDETARREPHPQLRLEVVAFRTREPHGDEYEICGNFTLRTALGHAPAIDILGLGNPQGSHATLVVTHGCASVRDAAGGVPIARLVTLSAPWR